MIAGTLIILSTLSGYLNFRYVETFGMLGPWLFMVGLVQLLCGYNLLQPQFGFKKLDGTWAWKGLVHSTIVIALLLVGLWAGFMHGIGLVFLSGPMYNSG